MFSLNELRRAPADALRRIRAFLELPPPAPPPPPPFLPPLSILLEAAGHRGAPFDAALGALGGFGAMLAVGLAMTAAVRSALGQMRKSWRVLREVMSAPGEEDEILE